LNDRVTCRYDVRVDPVKVADHVDEQRALAQGGSLALAAFAEMLVDNPVLERPENVLLLDQSLGTLDVIRCEHPCRKSQRMADDQAQIVERGMLLERKVDALLAL